MKTIMILGLLTVLAFAAPVASADIIIEKGASEEECETNQQSQATPPPAHVWIGIGPCKYEH